MSLKESREFHVQAFFTLERYIHFKTAQALDFCIIVLIVSLHIFKLVYMSMSLMAVTMQTCEPNLDLLDLMSSFSL